MASQGPPAIPARKNNKAPLKATGGYGYDLVRISCSAYLYLPVLWLVRTPTLRRGASSTYPSPGRRAVGPTTALLATYIYRTSNHLQMIMDMSKSNIIPTPR